MDFVFQRSYRGPVKAVIFDWAGTTVDYGSFAPVVAFVEVYKRHGVPITIEQAREPMGAHKRDHIRAISQMPSVQARWRAAFGRTPNEEDVNAMYREFVPLQVACLADYADLIPGTLEAVAGLRARGMKIGATTGYTAEMMEVAEAEAKKRGYVPDSSVCASQVPAGRPHPWMCFQNALNLQLYPMESFVKVGDTVPDILEGLNAGMWTIGVAKTGNELGLTELEVSKVENNVLKAKLAAIHQKFFRSGAHYVVDGISDVPEIIDRINARLERGERP